MARLIKRYMDGSELVVEIGLSLQHAQGLARRYAELEQSAEYSYVAQEEDPEPLSSVPVKVPPDVLEGLERIRKSAKINMRDRIGVEMLAYDMGLFHAVIWLEEHQAEYARGISSGFEAEHG
ncbi:MAG: DUF5049 domain-containing protein [Actinomycetota bacterium]|jgi:hypothetical protein|nr:DUF5049 domain-containing protein [Actinomycetota bacterium]